jgi:DNA polymerase zeta
VRPISTRAREHQSDIWCRQKRLDAAYYISRVLIPPLERVFNLIGADVRAWYDEMPKSVRVDAGALSPRKARADRALAAPLAIEEHFVNAQCILCGAAAIAGAYSHGAAIHTGTS